MLLSLSTAENLFWLGRYMARVESLCQILPFTDDGKACAYANAFGLSAWNAQTLQALFDDPNTEFSVPGTLAHIQINTQNVRGVLSQSAFESLHRLADISHESFKSIADLVAQSSNAFAHEQANVRVFWQLGVRIEALDRALRLQEPLELPVARLQEVTTHLPAGWQTVHQHMQQLVEVPDLNTFYNVLDILNSLFFDGPADHSMQPMQFIQAQSHTI